MAKLRIKVVYALAGEQRIVSLDLADGATAQDAAAASALPCQGLDLGVGGKRVAPGSRLHDGDRVELLRPLAADPKEARRQRARRARRR